jgi:hypothetical protein
MSNSKTEKKIANKTTTTKSVPAKKVTKNEQPIIAEPKSVEQEVVVEEEQLVQQKPLAPKKNVAKKTTVKSDKNFKVVKKTKVQKNSNDENEDEEEEPGKRYFKCIMITSEDEVIATGRYSGKKPKQAASKACTKLFEDIIESGQELPEHIIYGMHECTRASKKKKKYFYIGKRVELEEPEAVKIHLRDPITKEALLDKKGNKIPKIDPKTNKPMVINYYHNNDVRKLTNVDTHPEYERLAFYDAKDDGENLAKIKVVKKTARKTGPKKGSKNATKKVVGKKATATKKPSTSQLTKKTVVNKETTVKVKKAGVKPVLNSSTKPVKQTTKQSVKPKSKVTSSAKN